MAAIIARPAPLPSHSAPPSPPLAPAALPHRRLPYCPPGPHPTAGDSASSQFSVESELAQSSILSLSTPAPAETTSLLYPPAAYDHLSRDPDVFALSAAQFAKAVDHIAAQPLPTPRQVFPWLHGLHAENHLQLAFFTARKKSLRRVPHCLRGLTVVKANGDLSHSRIRGAIRPDEILAPPTEPDHSLISATDASFYDVDPRDGFGVRNFQIQVAKMAAVSDIVVYADDHTSRDDAVALARRISIAQVAWHHKTTDAAAGPRRFNTFVLTDDFSRLESDHSYLVAIDAEGCPTPKNMDFFRSERLEMCTMSAASEIAPNVWVGPTPDPSLYTGPDRLTYADNIPDFDILVEASDVAQIPDAKAFEYVEKLLLRRDDEGWTEGIPNQLEFPGSGAILPPTWSHAEADGLLMMCQWMHRQANNLPAEPKKRRDSKLTTTTPTDADGDVCMASGDDAVSSSSSSSSQTYLPRNQITGQGRKILIHCTDGYTETSLLSLAYYMYAHGVPVHDAWLQLHKEKGRNFFAYPSDVHLLRAVQPRILQASPCHQGSIHSLCAPPPAWLKKMDGSLPSRILPYMYLGNISHANNPEMLRALGIGQVLSVGEPVAWNAEDWPRENLMLVDCVQDNGVDPLTEEFGRCLEFIENGRKQGTATLVHCRVGVSRSATICIAEVMNELGLTLPRAYCFVRARRLNVIIQPHLRFMYELLKWEEFQCQKRGRPLRRELEWPSICREIAAMNKPYSRQS